MYLYWVMKSSYETDTILIINICIAVVGLLFFVLIVAIFRVGIKSSQV